MDEVERIAREAWESRGFILGWDHLHFESRETLFAAVRLALGNAEAPPVPTPAPSPTFPDWPDFRFLNGPFENSRFPTLIRRDPEGGDPHILCELKRIYNPEAIHELVDRANACQQADYEAYLARLA